MYLDKNLAESVCELHALSESMVVMREKCLAVD